MPLPPARLVIKGSRHVEHSHPSMRMHGAVAGISVIHNDDLFQVASAVTCDNKRDNAEFKF
jgi:hypothetical protein